MNMSAHNLSRTVLFVIFNAVVLAVYYLKLGEFIELNELYSHIILIPFVSGYFFYQDREKIFSDTSYSLAPGLATIAAGALIYLIGTARAGAVGQNDYYSVLSLAAIVTWAGGFILFYGLAVLKRGLFPVLFLVLMIPIPSVIVDKIIFLLQSASTEVSYIFFRIVGVPVFREGFVFHLPGVSVEVAKQCSGIRSSIALFITSIIAGHMFLQTGWKKVLLVFVIFPLTIFKNGIRILTLSLLGAYVDMSFLTDSALHKRGGIVFFIMAFVFFLPVFWFLIRSEKKRPAGGPRRPVQRGPSLTPPTK